MGGLFSIYNYIIKLLRNSSFEGDDTQVITRYVNGLTVKAVSGRDNNKGHLHVETLCFSYGSFNYSI